MGCVVLSSLAIHIVSIQLAHSTIFCVSGATVFILPPRGIMALLFNVRVKSISY